MQIHYYQNHYNEYLSDAIAHLKDKEQKTPKLERTNTNNENSIDDMKSMVTLEDRDEQPPPELLTQLVSASTTSSSLFVSFKEFYIRELDYIDLYKEYRKWLQIGDSPIGYFFRLCTFSILTTKICYFIFL
jgi:hypothetical protein